MYDKINADSHIEKNIKIKKLLHVDILLYYSILSLTKEISIRVKFSFMIYTSENLLSKRLDMPYYNVGTVN